MSQQFLVVGSYTEKLGHVDGKGKGLYVLKFDHAKQTFAASAGLLGKPQLSSLQNPTYLTSYRSTPSSTPSIYIVEESNDSAGFVSAATLDEETGELKALGPAIPAAGDAKGKKGAACCHISASPGGEHVLAANYHGGSVVSIRRAPDGSLDAAAVQYVVLPPESHQVKYPGPNAGRQDVSHAHMCLFSRGTHATTLLVPDLGSDLVWSIPYDATKAKPLGVPIATAAGHTSLEGGGPRHAALHPTKPIVYIVYELTSQAAAFALDPMTGAIIGPPLCVCNVMDGSQAPFLGGGSSRVRRGAAGGEAYSQLVQQGGICSDKATSIAAARVTPSGSHLIVSNRIVSAPGALSSIPLLSSGSFGRTMSLSSTLGHTPRDFTLVAPPAAAAKAGKRKATEAGVLALAANQDSDEITLMREGADPHVLTMEVPTPVCLCFV